MWKWLQSLRAKRPEPSSKEAFDEFGDLGLSTQAKVDIDQLREAKGWGVRAASPLDGVHRHSFGSTSTGMSSNVARQLARSWYGTRR